MALTILAGAMIVLLLLVWAESEHAEDVDRWRVALTPRVRDRVDSTQRAVERQLDTADDTYALAAVWRDQGRLDEARRLLDLAQETLESFATWLREHLRSMRVQSRLLGALLPVAPLRAHKFRMPGLVGWALLLWLPHHMVFTEGQRYRLKAGALGRGFAWALRKLRRGSRRVTAEPRSWQPLEAPRADIRHLSEEAVGLHELLLTSMAHAGVLAPVKPARRH